jgi:hypothetical protein
MRPFMAEGSYVNYLEDEVLKMKETHSLAQLTGPISTVSWP